MFTSFNLILHNHVNLFTYSVKKIKTSYKHKKHVYVR